jgi:subtilisin family serine protease
MRRTTGTRRLAGGPPAAGNRAWPASGALAGAIACALVAAGPPDVAKAGTIQAPVLRRIMADSLANLGLSDQAKALLRGTEPTVGADGRIAVRVALDPATGGTDGPIVPLVHDAPPAWLTSVPDCRVRGSLGPCVEVRIPPAQVRSLAAHSTVLHVGLPPHPLPLAESQGLSAMRVPEFWSQFPRGDGVRVGILDVGFANYERLLGSELPAHVVARAFFDAGTGLDITGGGESHGTACAEIVHDVAPEAELYLANANDPEQLRQAVTWLIDQGVEVISHSLAWPLGGGDGTGPIHDVVRLARNNDVIWVNAAGNFARGHWGDFWRDADHDRILDVDSVGNEAIRLPASNSGREVSVWLNWDRWPFSIDLEFEVDLLAPGGELLASSQTDQADSPYAFRSLELNSNTDLSGSTLRIRCPRGDPEGRFVRVIRTDGDLAPESRVPAGSLAMPADSPDAIAVGAYAWTDHTLEPFSSFGPTLDGRAKPEILGPDGVQNSVRDPFLGTSAACPHVAGAIALLLGGGPRGGLFDARPDLAQVTALLRREAGSLDIPAPEGAAGWGCVRLPVNRTKSDLPRLIVRGNGSGLPVLRLEATAGLTRFCEVFDLQGRLRARLEGATKGDGVIEFPAAPLAGEGLVRGRYWAREPVTGACVSFLWPGSTLR